MMKKKGYQKPTMKVVILQHRTMLLAGSGVQSMRSGYGDANDGVSAEELAGDTWVWD